MWKPDGGCRHLTGAQPTHAVTRRWRGNGFLAVYLPARGAAPTVLTIMLPYVASDVTGR